MPSPKLFFDKKINNVPLLIAIIVIIGTSCFWSLKNCCEQKNPEIIINFIFFSAQDCYGRRREYQLTDSAK